MSFPPSKSPALSNFANGPAVDVVPLPLSPEPQEGNSNLWKWTVCGLLLLASAINYMDRQTLAVTSVRITTEFGMTDAQYGKVELAFGWAFAGGALIFGFLADVIPVRWLYPAVLLLWSGAGFATGLTTSYEELWYCRLFLGLFEAGHWPCALKTTQRLLAPKDRTLGNSVLQSGTSIGAIATPIVMITMLTDQPGSWQLPFKILGGIGVLWALAWLLVVRKEKPESAAPTASTAPDGSLWSVIASRNFWVLIVVVISINTCWHIFRVWLPKFLQSGRDFGETEMLMANSAFYLFTDVGCLAGGFITLMLYRRGATVFRSRMLVFAMGCALTALSLGLPVMPKGWVLIAAIMLMGAGALALFPCYYSLTQDISTKHQGKVVGLLGAAAWLASSPVHPVMGAVADRYGSYDLGMQFAGAIPLVALLALALFWKPTAEPEQPSFH